MLLLTRRLDPGVRGSLANGAMRPNGAFIGLPIIQLAAQQLDVISGGALLGAYVLVLGPAVIVFNLGAVMAFRWPHHGGGFLGAVAELPRNPILVSCAVGTALGAWRPGLLEGTVPGAALAMVAACAVPLALITAGLGLDLAVLRGRLGWLSLTTLAKLLIQPTAAWGACRVLGLDHATTAAVTILMASPAAMAAVPMARAMGGDPALMAALVTATTLLAPLTLYAWLALVLR
jgi:hypothetical protein